MNTMLPTVYTTTEIKGLSHRCAQAKIITHFLHYTVLLNKRAVKALLLSYHDDEEVKNMHPAQLALDQGHQILDNDGGTNHGVTDG